MPPFETTQLFSPAQLAGYAAFILGITAFLQRDDRRLKLFLVAECAAYVVHFLLLGNPPAAGSAGVSGIRTWLSLRFRSKRLALLFTTVYLSLGATLIDSAAGWLPIVGACCATWGLLCMQGIRMRLTVLVSTALWLANNILSHSIGGTILEAFIAVANLTTISRAITDSKRVNAARLTA